MSPPAKVLVPPSDTPFGLPKLLMCKVIEIAAVCSVHQIGRIQILLECGLIVFGENQSARHSHSMKNDASLVPVDGQMIGLSPPFHRIQIYLSFAMLFPDTHPFPHGRRYFYFPSLQVQQSRSEMQRMLYSL